MGVSDIFVFVADAIYDYALAADTMQDTDEDDQESEGIWRTNSLHHSTWKNRSVLQDWIKRVLITCCVLHISSLRII